MLKGFWQIPLMEKAKEISAFVTPKGFCQYKVMSFGMKNAPATFQHLMNFVIKKIGGYDSYNNVLYHHEWGEYLKSIKMLFDHLTEARLKINLGKSEFVCALARY